MPGICEAATDPDTQSNAAKRRVAVGMEGPFRKNCICHKSIMDK
jgi:hypothetical protein